jgi:tol-pal system protein YbgF
MMKKTAVVILAGLALTACGNDELLIQKSMNNIKDEMLGIQSTMGDMQIKIQDLDKNIRINSENINKNSDALAQLREEMTVMNTDIIDLKERVTSLEKGTPVTSRSAALPSPADTDVSMSASAPKGTSDVIIIEDNMQDKMSLYTYAYELYRNGKYPESEAKFNEFLKKYPADERSDNAMYWIGEIRYGMKDFNGAVSKFRELLDEYPNGNKVPDAMLKLAYSYGSLSDKENSISTLQKLIADYPDSDAARLGKQKLAQWK